MKLTRLQCASLLANCFLCTFPHQGAHEEEKESMKFIINQSDDGLMIFFLLMFFLKDYYALKSTYPFFSFSRLFSSSGISYFNNHTALLEKLKCFIHYFEVVSNENCNFIYLLLLLFSSSPRN